MGKNVQVHAHMIFIIFIIFKNYSLLYKYQQIQKHHSIPNTSHSFPNIQPVFLFNNMTKISCWKN